MSSPLPRPEYPRPDFERADWLNLNGSWGFAFDDREEGEREKWQLRRSFPLTIQVPFCYQSERSGIGDTDNHEVVWYTREFAVPESYKGKRLLLHFGAVDFHAKVWINGSLAGEHRGGYTPFRFDITNLVQEGTNTIHVRVEDRLAASAQPRGKQRWLPANYGCWYTPVTGIWQTVWLEPVSDTHLDRVKMTPDLDQGSLQLDVSVRGPIALGCMLKAYVSYEGTEIAETAVKVTRSALSLSIDIRSDRFKWKVMAWTPAEPRLYTIRFELITPEATLDAAGSYFGMRKISTKQGMVLLNNQPIYQRLILNQGYYDGGLLTAEDDAAYVRDIELTKQMGFNGVRMHQKAEDPRFLYWADKLGLLVWGEMASPYEFGDDMMTVLTDEWRGIVERDYNHPSIVTWVLMNESWGIREVATDKKQQHAAIGLYHLVKTYDSTRPVISNDGWEHTASDVATFHDYTQDGAILQEKLASKEFIVSDAVGSIGNELGAKYLFAEGFAYAGQPLILSECCGVAFGTGEGWGYGANAGTEQQFLERYRSVIQAICRHPHIVGFCATQLTDVEQEVNGLLTIDRKPKADLAALAAIIRGE